MRDTRKELLAWGHAHNYPQLVLSVDTAGHVADYVKHGELHWHRMARDGARRKLAWQRVHLWQEYLQRAS